MGQVELGAVFMSAQVATANTNDISFMKETKRLNEHTFSKELDKAKTLHEKNEDKNYVNKVKRSNASEALKKVEKQIEKTDSPNEEKIEVESEDNVEEDKDEGELDDKILLLLSQTLNVDLEELKELLKQMGYVASDLLEQQKFGEFMSEAYTQIKGENLLMVETGVKDIGTLFEQLQGMNEEAKVTNDVNTIEYLLEKDEPILPSFSDSNFAKNQITNGTIEIISNNSEQTKKFQSLEVDSSLLSSNTIGEVSELDTGMIVPIQNFSSTVYTQLLKSEGAPNIQIPQLIETDIIDQIDFKTLGITKEIHMQLSPKELGELSIKLIEENSSIVAHIKVDNEKAKMFLLNQLGNLREALEERGLTVVDVKVDINQSSHQSQMEQEKQKSSKRIQEIISKHLEVFEEEEVEQAKEVNNSEVDYMV